MTVKEVFDLRKQGKTEEAYAAIRPMYAEHKGKYTTLCMFWVGSDMLKKCVAEKRNNEACKIFEALLRVQPAIDDHDGKVHEAVLYDALRLAEHAATFSVLSFIERYGVERLREDDWMVPLFSVTPLPTEKGGRQQPVAMRLLTRCYHELVEQPTVDQALRMMPLLQEAVRRNPVQKNCLRYMAVVYRIMGERQKAVEFYQLALTRYHDSYFFAELAELTDDEGERAALLCRAIQNQRQARFATAYRFALAQLLAGRDDSRAAYELQQCIATRRALHYAITSEMLQMEARLKGVVPVSKANEEDFYRRMAKKFPLHCDYRRE